MKKLQLLIFHFYKPLLGINIILTGCALYEILVFGIASVMIAITIKLFGYLICIGYQYFMSPKVYFYYRNAGYSARLMYAYTFAADLVTFLLFTIPFHLIHNVIANTKS